MKPYIFFLKGTKRIFTKGEQKEIGLVIQRTFHEVAKLLPIKGDVNFVAYPYENPIMVDDIHWIKGLTYGANWINLSFPSGSIDEISLQQAVYHELHHIAREYLMTNFSYSLIETVFAEGLATAFEMERVPNRLVRYGQYNEKFVKKWIPLLKNEMQNVQYDYDAWFFGKNKEKERWIGYRLGTWLVHQIMERHPKRNPANLVRVPTKKLLELSGVV